MRLKLAEILNPDRQLGRIPPSPNHSSTTMPTAAVTMNSTNSVCLNNNQDDPPIVHRASIGSLNRRSTRASIDPSSRGVLSFHNISYNIGRKNTKCHLPCLKVNSGRQIIENVSGIFAPGMNAIMG